MSASPDPGPRVLVVGGTGMLLPLCLSLPRHEVVVAARLASHPDAVAALRSRGVALGRLDWSRPASRAAFLRTLEDLSALEAAVLWVHTPAHHFSVDLMRVLAARPAPPAVVHLFGTAAGRPAAVRMAGQAARLGVPFAPVVLGRGGASGERWMTDAEISTAALGALATLRPGLAPGGGA